MKDQALEKIEDQIRDMLQDCPEHSETDWPVGFYGWIGAKEIIDLISEYKNLKQNSVPMDVVQSLLDVCEILRSENDLPWEIRDELEKFEAWQKEENK